MKRCLSFLEIEYTNRLMLPKYKMVLDKRKKVPITGDAREAIRFDRGDQRSPKNRRRRMLPCSSLILSFPSCLFCL